MTDILPNRVPLPQNRPSGLFTEYQPTTDFKMPLEGPRKAADAFSEVGSYHPSFDPLKLTSELLMAFKRHIDFLGEKIMELLSQTYPHYVEPGSRFVANVIEFVLYGVLAAGVAVILYLAYQACAMIARYFRGS